MSIDLREGIVLMMKPTYIVHSDAMVPIEAKKKSATKSQKERKDQKHKGHVHKRGKYKTSYEEHNA